MAGGQLAAATAYLRIRTRVGTAGQYFTKGRREGGGCLAVHIVYIHISFTFIYVI